MTAEPRPPGSVNDVRCSTCKAPVGEPCRTPSGNPAHEPHVRRVARFWKRSAN